jgi:hypothetical protein
VTLYDPRRPTTEQLWTVDDFWSPAECAAMIASAEQRGFDEAPVTTALGAEMRKDVRNNERVMFEDRVLAAVLFEKIYLDDAFEGGQTVFHDDGVIVAPKTGMALFFHHPILHEGRMIERGVKHVLRTDVMYRRSDR